MAGKKRSTSKKTCNRIPSFTKRSQWAAYMNGADIEWLDTTEAQELARVFDGHFPSWLIDAEPWRQVDSRRFQIFRRDIIGLTVAQCAAYLRVSKTMVTRWENGSSAIPFSAFEALRLQYYSTAQRLTHREWDGWFINRRTGELVSPDLGRLAVKPVEINSIPLLHAELSMLKCKVDQQAKKMDALEAENAQLRAQSHYRQLVADLETMQGQIGALLEGIKTAEVLPFSKPSEEHPLRAVA